MNIDATTFALEVLNFLVLVWLLKRFFYRPVLDVIERRRLDDEKSVAQARQLREEADALRKQYEARLAHAADDRTRAQAALDAEIAAARAKRLAAVDTEAEAELARRRALQARELERHEAEREHRAVALGARFAARLLDRVAGPALEDRLVELALQDLASLAPEPRARLQTALQAAEAPVQVASANPLAAPRREALTAALAAIAGRPLAPAFVEDPALKAGLSVRAGSWMLLANLRDELAFFDGANGHAV